MTDEGEDGEDTRPPSLEERTTKAGRLPGNRYVRIHHSTGFRRRGGIYVAEEAALAPKGAVGRGFEALRRFLFGPPLSAV